ncbi:MAG: HAD hydrolase-like protein, partial [Acholeplasmatales bacterium]|nr:HAD hydrolase-like protein [Acholeplasmatales bacterium]
PDERFFNYIFNDLNDYEKKNYVIIGDRLDSDILGGKISGIKAIYLNRDNTKGDIKPDYEIKSFKEITVIL